MDEKISIAGRPIDKPFLMAVESTYSVAGRGCVACGTIEQGKIKIGDDIEFFGYNKKFKSQAIGVETFNKTLDYGEAGDNVGVLVRGLNRDQINRGLMIGKPGSMSVNSVIEANIYCLKTEEGGRVNPFSSGYRPQVILSLSSSTTKPQIQLQKLLYQKESKSQNQEITLPSRLNLTSLLPSLKAPDSHLEKEEELLLLVL